MLVNGVLINGLGQRACRPIALNPCWMANIGGGSQQPLVRQNDMP